MNKKSLRRVAGILTICFAGVLSSVNHNVSYENRIPSWIIIGLFTIGGWTLFSGRKPRIEGQERQAVEQNILRLDRQAKWVAVGILAVGLIGIVVVCVSDTPTATRANKIDFVPLQQQRDLSAPSSRLVGRWENVDDGSELLFSPIDPALVIGTYRIRNKGYGCFGRPFRFKILFDDPSGTQLVIRPYGHNEVLRKLSAEIRMDCTSSDVIYSIPKHGQSMTVEYTFGGSPMLSVYRYVDNITAP